MKKIILLLLLLTFITNTQGQSKVTETRKIQLMQLIGVSDADGEPILDFIDLKTKDKWQLDINDKKEIGNQTALNEIYKTCGDGYDVPYSKCKIIGQIYSCTLDYKLVDIYDWTNEGEAIKTGKKEKSWVLTKLVKVNNQDSNEEIKKLLKVLSPEEIDTLLIEKTKKIIFNGYQDNGFLKSYSINPKYNKLLSIRITNKISNKDRATLYNLEVENQKAELNAELVKEKEKRKELKTKFPENFVFNEDDCFCRTCGPMNETEIAYCDFKFLTKKIVENTHKLDELDVKLLDDEFWNNETKNRFFIEVSTLPINNGLDDNKPEIHVYFGYYNSEEEEPIYVNIPPDDFINRSENNYERNSEDFNSNALKYLKTIFFDKN